ncbi:unnamed protein product [Meloidogyne enterolobii]|uniref:Uncharacterized protein n=2 Tax=Meloidogyne enterolobii TaxID=390850 RepID=A0ACB1AUC6_MELEN
MLYEDPRNRCCCAIHVAMGANIIGGIGVFLSLCFFIICLLYGRWGLIVLPVIFCFAYASIFYAFYSRNAKIYWPFLITNVCNFLILELSNLQVSESLPSIFQPSLF